MEDSIHEFLTLRVKSGAIAGELWVYCGLTSHQKSREERGLQHHAREEARVILGKIPRLIDVFNSFHIGNMLHVRPKAVISDLKAPRSLPSPVPGMSTAQAPAASAGFSEAISASCSNQVFQSSCWSKPDRHACCRRVSWQLLVHPLPLPSHTFWVGASAVVQAL